MLNLSIKEQKQILGGDEFLVCYKDASGAICKPKKFNDLNDAREFYNIILQAGGHAYILYHFD